jgi:hypothetical protein
MTMAETATAMATATKMMPPPLPMATMPMTTMAAIRGRWLDDGDSTTTMGRQRFDGNGWQQHAERLQVLRHPSRKTIKQCGQFGEEWFGPAPPIGRQKARRQQQWQGNVVEATLTKTALTAMEETATAMATATAMVMMRPPLPMATMSMTTTAALQGRQWDDDDWTMTMGQHQCDGCGRPATCRTLASAAPPIEGKNQPMWTVWGGGDEREGRFGGIEPQKQVKVELIEWRSIDLHSIDFESTFRPPQSGKRTGTYSAWVLGVRLRYRRHGEHLSMVYGLCLIGGQMYLVSVSTS